MWIFATIALVSIGGVICSESERCIHRKLFECGPGISNHIPTSIEELDDTCSAVQDMMQCSIKALPDCENVDEVLEFLVDSSQFVEQACDTDGRIYKAVSSSLECLSTAMPKVSETCFNRAESQDILEALEERMMDKGYDMKEVSDCINAMWLDACAAVVISDECGEDAADAMVDIFINLDYRLHQCQEDVIDELKVLISAIMEIEYIEEDVENSLRRKKK